MSLLTREELLTFCEPREYKAPEFTEEQTKRLDDITNAAQGLLEVIAESNDIEYDMLDIWGLILEAAHRLQDRGRRIRIPTRVTRQDGSMYITDWFEEDEESDIEWD